MEDQSVPAVTEEVVAEGTIVPVEAAPEAAAPEPAKEDSKVAAKFAALSRREKEIRQREAKVAAHFAEYEAKLKAYEEEQAEIAKYRDLPNRLKREPLKVLEETGLTFEQLAEMVLNDGKPTQDMVLSDYEKKFNTKLQELEAKLAEKESKEQEAKVEAAINQYKAQLTDFVNGNEEYELIKAHDAMETVFEVIEQHHTQTGQILSNKEACDAVEEYLLEEAKKLVDREKVKKLLQQQAAPKTPVQGKSPTLSNAQAAQAGKSGSLKKLSDEESKAEAAKLIRWID